ncbi:MAG: trehalose-6-phosphate synthase [Candidatus Omnitrophota bacterium]
MTHKEKKMIIASNRLPFYRKKGKSGKDVWKKSAGGLITAIEPILLERGGIWVGWDGFFAPEPVKGEAVFVNVEEINPQKEGSAGRGKIYKLGCVPITESESEGYYNRFSNGTLWALFHYFFEKSFIDYAGWRAYCEINKRFASSIDKIAGKKDIVWIQDFHLFLVPLYLRQKRPKQEIHFFLHIPFPHIDIFSILPWQDTILKSLLCCDTVGFHHKQYLRNFKRAAELYQKRTESSKNTYFYVNPISVDFDLIDKTAREECVLKRKEEIRRQTACRKMIVGVDRIDYSKGIKERLLAVEELLKNHPELKEQFFYYQLVVPSRELVGTYKTLKKEIDEIIGRINGKFSTGLWSPIHYNYGTVPFEELIALYSSADVALVTPLRDGMNLVCKEFVAAHADNDGVLVLSKFAGAIAEIKNCLAVNPYSIEDIADAIYRALFMKKRERNNRMRKMRKNVQSHDINVWLNNCLKYFEISRREKSERKKKKKTPDRRAGKDKRKNKE